MTFSVNAKQSSKLTENVCYWVEWFTIWYSMPRLKIDIRGQLHIVFILFQSYERFAIRS